MLAAAAGGVAAVGVKPVRLPSGKGSHVAVHFPALLCLHRPSPPHTARRPDDEHLGHQTQRAAPHPRAHPRTRWLALSARPARLRVSRPARSTTSQASPSSATPTTTTTTCAASARHVTASARMPNATPRSGRQRHAGLHADTCQCGHIRVRCARQQNARRAKGYTTSKAMSSQIPTVTSRSTPRATTPLGAFPCSYRHSVSGSVRVWRRSGSCDLRLRDHRRHQQHDHGLKE